MNIALIVHFTPQTLKESRGYVVSSSEMAGGKKKKRYVKRALHPETSMGKRGEKVWGVCMCIDIL